MLSSKIWSTMKIGAAIAAMGFISACTVEPPGGRYSVKLKVTTTARTLSVETSSLSPTSAQVAVLVNYTLVDKTTGKTVSKGKRRSLSSFDRTPQSFANERAQRDAENRAAKEAAQQIRLSLAQTISSL